MRCALPDIRSPCDEDACTEEGPDAELCEAAPEPDAAPVAWEPAPPEALTDWVCVAFCEPCAVVRVPLVFMTAVCESPCRELPVPLDEGPEAAEVPAPLPLVVAPSLVLAPLLALALLLPLPPLLPAPRDSAPSFLPPIRTPFDVECSGPEAP